MHYHQSILRQSVLVIALLFAVFVIIAISSVPTTAAPVAATRTPTETPEGQLLDNGDATEEPAVNATETPEGQQLDSGDATEVAPTETASEDAIDVTADAEDVIAALRDKGLITIRNVGKQIFTVPSNTFLKLTAPGITSVTIGRGAATSHFVLNAHVLWDSAGDASACGFGFWSVNSRTFAMAMLGNDGTAILFQTDNGKSVFDYEKKSDAFAPGEDNIITVITDKSKINMLINGKLVTSQTGKLKKGKFFAGLFNAKDNTTLTHCTYPSGWIWDLDQ
ncbi:MAG: hypothetical protein ABI947_07475 [Chloroflexota bacterium]